MPVFWSLGLLETAPIAIFSIEKAERPGLLPAFAFKVSIFEESGQSAAEVPLPPAFALRAGSLVGGLGIRLIGFQDDTLDAWFAGPCFVARPGWRRIRLQFGCRFAARFLTGFWSRLRSWLRARFLARFRARFCARHR